MQLSRRNFLMTQGAVLGAALAPHSLLAAAQANTAPLPSLDDWSQVRRQFRMSPDYLHFSYFFLASHPEPVRAAIEGYRRAIDDNPYLVVEHALFGSEAENLHRRVCGDMAPYLGVRPEEIAIVGNTTTGLTLVYQGLPLRAGDEVLVTEHDHFVHHEAVRLATARSGAVMRKFSMYENAATVSADEMVARTRAAIKPQTRVLGITWVHSSTGVRAPVRAIADVVAEINRGRDANDRLRLLVDGVHGLGAVDESVADLKCDFFCAGAHKWMFGPRGTGIVWARAEEWARLRPLTPSVTDLEPYMAWLKRSGPSSPNNASRSTAGGFHAFEYQWAMGTAFQMHRQMGRARVATRVAELNSRLKDGLVAIRGLKLHTPRDPALSAGMCCFEIDGHKPDEIVRRLLERKVLASTTPYAPTYARLSAGLMNMPDEVDQALAAVRTVARAS
jgi:isopenicillin-N epimerase